MQIILYINWDYWYIVVIYLYIIYIYIYICSWDYWDNQQSNGITVEWIFRCDRKLNTIYLIFRNSQFLREGHFFDFQGFSKIPVIQKNHPTKKSPAFFVLALVVLQLLHGVIGRLHWSIFDGIILGEFYCRSVGIPGRR